MIRLSRFVRNQVFFLVVISLLLLAVIIWSFLPGSPLNHLTSPFSAVFTPVQERFNAAADQVSGFYESLNEGMALRDENRDLRLENAALRNQVAQLEEAGRQYEQLKDAFKMKDQFAGYDLIGGRLLTREIGTWFDVFRIDVGTTDGVTVTETLTFAVVDAQSNLIGRVLSTDAVSAKILPVLHEGFAVSGKVNEVGGSLLRVRGDIDLKPQGLCLIDQIPANATIEIGDEIVSSGIGGLFPAGVPIGRVVNVIEADARDQRQAWLEPYAQLDELETVFVMIGRAVE